jgi:hypothetical protein
MKYNKVFFVMLLLAVGVIAGCTNDTESGASDGAFIGGSQGVLAEFEAFGVEEEGVFTIFDTETFPIEVTLTNKGEYELQPGDVSVSLLGPSQEEFSGISAYTLSSGGIIEEISDLIPDGGEETLSFGADVLYEGLVTGFVDRTWFANIEYTYQTYIIVPEVCLKEDLSDDRICDIDGDKEFFVSGAPITVTAVEEDTAGKGIMALKFKLSNVGGGESTLPGEEFKVNDELAFSLDDDSWECKSSGKINSARLRSGEAEVVCKLVEPLAEDHLSTKQVQLTLDYIYRDLVQETLRIKQSAE